VRSTKSISNLSPELANSMLGRYTIDLNTLVSVSVAARITPLESLQALLEDRFSDASEDNGGDEGGLQSLERLTWLRWMFFVLGTLPPTIKLASMRGVPWTKTIGMMYLTSFLIVEVLVVASKMSIGMSQDIMAWRGTPRGKFTIRFLDGIDSSLAWLSPVIQLIVFSTISVLLSICALENFDMLPYRAGHEPMIRSMILPIIIVVVLVLFSGLGLLTFPILDFNARVTYSTFVFLILIMLVGGFYNIMYMFMTTFGIFTIELCIVLLMVICLARLLQLFGLSLLMLPQPGSAEIDGVEAVLACFWFFCTLFYSLLGYAYLYNPSDTFNPSWAGVFG
jgi:hypothetical protein